MTVDLEKTARLRATWIGALATLMWATVPVAAIATRTVPPYQVVAMTFMVSSFVIILRWRKQGYSILHQLRMPPRIWALGIFGLFGFYLFHFIALREAPPIEAVLLINLWPLFMVLFSSLLERKPLRWWHVVGIVAGFSGVLVISASHGFTFESRYWKGYAAALVCAFVWSLYSAFSRKLANEIPTQAIACFCISNAVLVGLVHLAVEPTVEIAWPQGLMILYMGLIPMCLAYYAWDHGLRNGDMRVLGGLSYLGPVFGSALLFIFGYAPFDPAMIIAGVLILGGAFFSSWMTFSKTP